MTTGLVELEQRAHGLRLEVSRWESRVLNTTTKREDRKTPLNASDDVGRAAIDTEFADDLASLHRSKAEAEAALLTCERQIEEARKAPGRERRAAAGDEFRALLAVYHEAVSNVMSTAYAHAEALSTLHELETKLDRYALDRRAPLALQRPGLQHRLESLSWECFRNFYRLQPPAVAGNVNRPFAMRCRDMLEALEFVPDDWRKAQ